MKGTRHSEEQIIAILKQGERGHFRLDVARVHISGPLAIVSSLDQGHSTIARHLFARQS
jgi:hypothetical protein